MPILDIRVKIKQIENNEYRRRILKIPVHLMSM